MTSTPQRVAISVTLSSKSYERAERFTRFPRNSSEDLEAQITEHRAQSSELAAVGGRETVGHATDLFELGDERGGGRWVQQLESTCDLASVSTSLQDATAMRRKREKSRMVDRPAPSAMLAEIDTAARRSWLVRP